jgi:hypothetical protein
MAQCEGLNRNNQRCGNEALPGKRFCHLSSHGPRRLTRRQWVETIVGAVGFVAAIVGICGYLLQRADDRLNATSGTLSPSSLRTPEYLSFGGIKFHELNPDGIAIKDGNEPILTVQTRPFRSVACLWMWKCQRQMVVSAKVKDLKGEPIIELTNNEWSHQPRPAIFDRNYTDNILEVRNSETGRVFLQVVDLGETVYVAGTFICSHTLWTYTLSPGVLLEVRPPGAEISHVIQPICEYPSDLHLGQCSSKSVESLIKPNTPVWPVKTSLQVCTDLAAEENRKAQQQ